MTYMVLFNNQEALMQVITHLMLIMNLEISGSSMMTGMQKSSRIRIRRKKNKGRHFPSMKPF